MARPPAYSRLSRFGRFARRLMGTSPAFGYRGHLFDTQQYWDTRHRTSRGLLQSTGHIHLTEDQNRRDYEAKRRQLVSTLRALFPDPTGQVRPCTGVALLDAGCGTGVFTETFVDMGFAVTGVDFSTTALDACHHLDATFIRSDLAGLSLSRRFDVIVSVDVLFHIVEDGRWQRILRGLARHLSDGGVLIIQEHLVEEAQRPSQYSHVRFRTFSQYAGALSKCDLILHESLRYVLPCEATWKDILIAGLKGESRRLKVHP